MRKVAADHSVGAHGRAPLQPSYDLDASNIQDNRKTLTVMPPGLNKAFVWNTIRIGVSQSMPDPIEEQLREIFERMERQGPRRSLWARLKGRFRRFVNSFQVTIPVPGFLTDPGQLILVSVILVFSAWFLRLLLPRAGYYVGMLGLLLFLIGFTWSVLRAGRTPYRPRWRGRYIEDYSPYGDNLWLKIRRWWRRITGR